MLVINMDIFTVYGNPSSCLHLRYSSTSSTSAIRCPLPGDVLDTMLPAGTLPNMCVHCQNDYQHCPKLALVITPHYYSNTFWFVGKIPVTTDNLPDSHHLPSSLNRDRKPEARQRFPLFLNSSYLCQLQFSYPLPVKKKMLAGACLLSRACRFAVIVINKFKIVLFPYSMYIDAGVLDKRMYIHPLVSVKGRFTHPLVTYKSAD